MATTSSQQPANLANNNPPSIAARASSTNIQPHSESPTPGLTAPSSSLTAPTINGGTNGILSSTLSNDGSMHADLRQYPRDGRVRNPVPSKLKDVTEQMKGNFSVMHMDVASHRASEGRDAAAKRTSESTALQAKLAQTDSYVSHQRRANYPRPPGLKQFTSPKKSASIEPVAEIVPGPVPVSVPETASPLTITETKTEQARLLTLLRTLPPHTVVDQLCKALAFFGGIPEAPPPADGKFPESAESNGSGSLFVGWIAEIFPNLKEPRRRASFPSAQSVNQRRPRGRPKGSKASKSRSDKGIKKGTKGTANRSQEAQDDSWVDVEDSVLELNGDDDLVEVEGPSENAPNTPPQLQGGGQFSNTSIMGSTGGFKSINDATAILAPGSSAKRRGRPKGSKNRPKDMSGAQQAGQPADSTSANANAPPIQADHVSTLPVPPKVTPVPVPIHMLGEQPRKKQNSGRPKGSKNRPKAAGESIGQDGTISQQQQTADLPNQQISQHAVAGPSFTGGTTTSSITDSVASQNDQRAQLLPPPAISNSQVPTPQVKESSIVGKKRKRQSAPTGTVNPQTDGASDGVAGSNVITQQAQSGLSQATSAPISQTQPSAVQSIQQTSMNTNTTSSTKRPRKSQESGSLQAAKRSTPNNIGNKNPASSAAVNLDQTRQSGQVTAPSQSHTQAEGLEAHYERIAALQNRSDQVQNNTNRPQKPQQHQTTASIGSTTSPTPAEGLEAHYERFTALQNRQDNARQQTANRQQMQQQNAQTASPISSQTSKAPQMPSTLASHQQARPSQNYYQTQALSSSYNTQTPTYSTSQRQPQHMATGSPGTGLVQHMTNSPQFGAQSNSPLMQGDTNYRGSPSLVHSSTGYPPRRTPSASPLDSNYRAGGATSHGVSNHSPHFGARQTPTTTHGTSHPTMPSTFTPAFDSSFLELQTLDSGNNHGGLGLSTGSYGLSSGVPSQQRTTGSSAASLYSSATGMNNSYLPSSNVGRTTQNRWPS